MPISNVIAIASDHKGFLLKKAIKEHLVSKSLEYIDFGTNDEATVDYPDFAFLLSDYVAEQKCHKGILICNSGIGMSIAANRNRKIRAALCYDVKLVEMARKHNNANVLVLGAGYISREEAICMVDAFLDTEFDGARHITRVNKLS